MYRTCFAQNSTQGGRLRTLATPLPSCHLSELLTPQERFARFFKKPPSGGLFFFFLTKVRGPPPPHRHTITPPEDGQRRRPMARSTAKQNLLRRSWDTHRKSPLNI